MSVLDMFACPVSEDAKSTGLEYLRQGAVEIRIARGASVEATVRAPDGVHSTKLDWSRPSLGYSCTCGEFRRHGVCRHIVATALATEAAGHMGELPISSHDPQETVPRRRGQSGVFLSPTGQLRRLGEEDEPRPVIPTQPSLPTWRKQLARLKQANPVDAGPELPSNWPPDRQVLYLVDLPASIEAGSLVIKLACRDRKSTGEWSRPKTRGITFPDVANLTDPEDQRIIAMLKGAASRPDVPFEPSYSIPPRVRRLIVPLICKTGRALLRAEPDSDELADLQWDDREWELWVEAHREESLEQYVFAGSLRRGEERLPVSRALWVMQGGLVFFSDTVAPVNDGGAIGWVPMLKHHRSITVPIPQGNELLGELFALPNVPRLDLPEELKVETVRVPPKPILHVRAPATEEFRPDRLRADLSFDYDGTIVREGDELTRVVFQSQHRRLIVRDKAAERAASDRLRRLGLRDAPGTTELWFTQRHLPRIVRSLVNEGWRIDANGNLYRRANHVRLSVTSGIDWFELRGDVDFGEGRSAQLGDMLAAIRRGDTSVKLDDGSLGMLPDDWLRKYGLMAAMAQQEGDFLKFSKSQAGLLDALLLSQPEAACDELFQRTRDELRQFGGVHAEDAPQGFVGELRGYQREGLGWFTFLRRFGFGGCLADDMGLGKTVQVLALLEAQRLAAIKDEKPKTPSLVVVPKSLVFNWRQEAARFTPELKFLDHTGIDRIRAGEHLADYDVVVTTYGTLRRDAMFLKDVEFNYVILDEAQAVKNPSSESAKAVRLVRGNHRLALSGTPVQNHLGDLWSLFDFLNPGMLGSASVFNANGSGLRSPDEETRQVLARALRPFILRRTKEQVAQDLPPKLEQTIYCELDTEQRKLYNGLRDHFRQSLLSAIDRDGLGKSKMQILEALLRLRQAALHPGLIDKTRTGESSAKLDMLIPRLEEVIEEGHKALVFSQFTSMLAIVREALDKQGIAYEYLDGKTKDREERVRHFQDDPKCKLFLISLKAGGLGLNLTAADYVFLLDPWWNPAVEAQAIDRAHRIGQTQQVFACRLIAKDTVEEKVIALQQSKRDLADAIITADNSLVRSLAREDLELLLS
jgi:superfamily II DNA or RNA helicase